MQIGKLSEPVAKRSVYGLLGKKGKEPGNVTINKIGEQTVLVSANVEGIVAQESRMHFLFQRLISYLYAEGASNISVSAVLQYDGSAQEAELKRLVRKFDATAKEFDIVDVTLNVRATDSPEPRLVLFGNGINANAMANLPKSDFEKSGKSIVMVGYAGTEASGLLMEKERETLLTRLSSQYLNQGYKAIMSDRAEQLIEKAKSFGADIKTVGEGGVFAALWELGVTYESGMEINLPDIPMRQETIEICEVLDINPYMMLSGGCFLAITDDADGFMDMMSEEELPVVCIGRTTENNDRVLINGDEKRFLEPFRMEELYRAGILKG